MDKYNFDTMIYVVSNHNKKQKVMNLPHGNRQRQKSETRAREMTRWVRCLPCKTDDVSSVPKTHVMKGGENHL